jgi:hypothetical protein
MAYQDLSRENLEEREEVVSIPQVLKQVPHAPASLTSDNSYRLTYTQEAKNQVSDPDPYWIQIHQVSGSGSRRAKMTHKSRRKIRNFMFLKCWIFSLQS